MKVVVVMLMGAKEEPFLAACLESLHGSVDMISLNDNSGLAYHANLSVVQQSRLFQEKKITIIPSPFLGFGPCRDLCVQEIRKFATAEDWIIFVDCDEVHYPQLSLITRSILPNLPKNIGIVDTYFYHFYQFPRYFTSLDHRHNLMFRFNSSVSWKGQVHEKVVNLLGERLVLPYTYCHYGYLKSQRSISEKWTLYSSLGDPKAKAQMIDPQKAIFSKAKKTVEFTGSHPAVAEPFLNAAESEHAEEYRLFQDCVQKQMFFELRTQLIVWKIVLKRKWLRWNCLRQLSGAEPLPAILYKSIDSL